MRSFTELLAAAADREAPEDAVAVAISAIRRQPATEPAGFWTGIATDERRPAWQRRRALLELFRRHATGMTLHELGAVPGLARLVTAEHLYDRTHATKLPLDRRAGSSVIMFRPELPEGDDSAVYLLFSRPVSPTRLADSVAGRADDGDAQVVAVAVSD